MEQRGNSKVLRYEASLRRTAEIETGKEMGKGTSLVDPRQLKLGWGKGSNFRE